MSEFIPDDLVSRRQVLELLDLAATPEVTKPIERAIDAAAATLRQRVLALAGRKPQRGPRASVAMIVTDPHGRILLGRRASEPNKGKWGVPSGGIEAGETWVDAARREFREEAGLEASISPDQQPIIVENTGAKGNAQGFQGALILFVRGEANGTPHGVSDLADPAWFAPSNLPEGLSRVSEEALEQHLLWLYRDAEPIDASNSLVDGVVCSAEEFRCLVWGDRVLVDPGPSPAGNQGPYLHVPMRDSDVMRRVYPRRARRPDIDRVIPVRADLGWFWKRVEEV